VIQLTVLSGKMAGATYVTRRFPVRIGRAADSELRLEEEGVWDNHLLLDLNPAEGFSLKTQPQALARVNGQRVGESLLRSGDIIELGSVRIQFWLNRAGQSGLGLSEALSWGAIIVVFFGQIAILYWLLR
jgi:pSer/pThr/pTyr-binding forkhead associated (FHA) protein